MTHLPHQSSKSFSDPDPAVLVVWGLCSLILVCYGMTAFGAPLVQQLFVHHFAFVPAKLHNARGLPALFLHVLLHANLAHLFVNLGFLLAFGVPLAKRLGGGLFLVVFFLATMGGALSEFVLDTQDQARRIGASGGVSGLMGALCAFPIVKGRAGLPGPFADRTKAGRFVVLWFVVNALVGLLAPVAFGSKIAWVGHCGGFLVGLAVTALALAFGKKD